MAKKSFICDLSGKEFSLSEKISAKSIRRPIIDLLQKDCPSFSDEKCLALSELNIYREKFVADFLAKEIGEFSDLEKTVLSSLREGNTLVDKIEDVPAVMTVGQRLADKVASFGGSWSFIITFGS